MSDESKPVSCGCGGEAEVYTQPLFGCYIICGNCGMRTRLFINRTEAIEAWNRAMGAKEWIPCSEAKPKNTKHNWALGQIRETDSGYLWMPRQVEYRQITDDWYEEGIGWFKKNPDHAFEVIAWMPLPEVYRGDR